MTYQPNDISHCMYDENKFQNINTVLSFRDNSQSITNKSDIDLDFGKNSLSQSDDLLVTNNTNEFDNGNFDSCTTPTLAPSYNNDEQLFPGCEFDESQFLDLFEGPINEITITTTISNAENNNNTPSELNSNEYKNSTPNDIETFLKQTCDQYILEILDGSIQQRTMSIETEPPINLRPRYKSDGTRQIEKSRTKPMVIKLPDLTETALEPNQSFFLRLVLVTHSKKQSDQVYFHVNKFEYHSNDVQELSDGTVCVPLTADDIAEGKKKLPRSSIVKTKLEAYKSELTPFSQSANDELHENIDENESEKISVKQAKKIFKQYNMQASRIICQLLIKQNESWRFTNIACETNVITEKEEKNTRKKRSANAMNSDDEESLYERPCSSKSKSIKRKKRSNC